MVSKLSKSPEVIVLGSSRAMAISSQFFPDRDLLNNSVSGATIEDYLGIYSLYRNKSFKPKLVVLGLDPWILNRNHGQVRWEDLYAEVAEMRTILGIPSSQRAALFHIVRYYRKYTELLSPTYFKRCCADVLRKNKRGKDYWATDQVALEEPVKISDGSYEYGRAVRERTVEQINKEARSFVMTTPVYSLGSFATLDHQYMDLVERFVGYLAAEKIQVMFFLSPYHPMVNEAFSTSAQYAMVAEAEKWYRALARKHSVEIVGSFDPITLQLCEADFIDGMHPQNKAVFRIFDSRPDAIRRGENNEKNLSKH
jgi:hypothetical protein